MWSRKCLYNVQNIILVFLFLLTLFELYNYNYRGNADCWVEPGIDKDFLFLAGSGRHSATHRPLRHIKGVIQSTMFNYSKTYHTTNTKSSFTFYYCYFSLGGVVMQLHTTFHHVELCNSHFFWLAQLVGNMQGMWSIEFNMNPGCNCLDGYVLNFWNCQNKHENQNLHLRWYTSWPWLITVLKHS